MRKPFRRSPSGSTNRTRTVRRHVVRRNMFDTSRLVMKHQLDRIPLPPGPSSAIKAAEDQAREERLPKAEKGASSRRASLMPCEPSTTNRQRDHEKEKTYRKRATCHPPSAETRAAACGYKEGESHKARSSCCERRENLANAVARPAQRTHKKRGRRTGVRVDSCSESFRRM